MRVAAGVEFIDENGGGPGVGLREVSGPNPNKPLYLPKSSPDLNPIEQAFSKFKALLRKASERTIAGLCRKIGKLIAAFSATECAHFLAHAGYASK